jgi:hypothetical protein
MSNFLGPEEMDIKCGNMMHIEVKERGFTVFVGATNSWATSVKRNIKRVIGV